MRIVFAFVTAGLALVGLLGTLLFVLSGEWEKVAPWGLLAGVSLMALASCWLMDEES